MALSNGRQVNDVLLLQPTTTAWMYQEAGGSKIGAIGKTFQNTVMAFERAQVQEALTHNQGNKAAAARELGVSVRGFYKMLDRLDL